MRNMPAKTTSKSASAKTSTRTAKAVKTPDKKVAKASSKDAAKTAAAPVAKTRKTRTKAAVVSKTSTAEPILEVPVISRDEIQLRAYFISERRQTMGWPGNSSTDWIEAESQLIAEAKRRLKKSL